MAEHESKMDTAGTKTDNPPKGPKSKDEKPESKDSKPGRRKLSIFGSVLRRVSIHRKESSPTGRQALFVFGGNDDLDDIAQTQETLDEVKMEGGPNDPIMTEYNNHSNGANIKRRTPTKSKKAILLDSLFVILSGLYGLLIVVLGAVIPLTETFVEADKAYAFENILFQAFYIYLYVISIVFLVYVYVYLLRRNRLKSEFLARTLSRSLSWTRAWAKTWVAKGETDKNKPRKRRISMDESNHHTGSFYLRLGAVGFGIGSMIHSGLNFGQFFQLYDGPAYCSDVTQAIEPFLHLVFTFVQLYFIFSNSKMCIHSYKTLARFGLMHMCGTNICVWFRSIVVETLHVIHQHAHDAEHGKDHGSDQKHTLHNAVSPLVNMTKNGSDLSYKASTHSSHILTLSSNGNYSMLKTTSELTCNWNEMMGKAVESAGPYLYPCTIEYSLMSAGILYIMWKNVGKRQKHYRSESDDEDDEADLKSQRMSVDCAGSSRGLFLGILLTVGAIISIVAFYVLTNEEDEMQRSAVILTHLSETTMYLLTTLAIIMAADKMRVLHFHSERKSDLEDILILISYTGLQCFSIFSLAAAILHPSGMYGALTIISNVAMMIQAALQTIFMLAGDRVSAYTTIQERKKPGREFVTFLLLCNFAIWAMNTFETQTPDHNPVQVEFYGPDAWAIFTHISVPLGIYYRFHSTVCLSNIWKNAWKIRKHM